MLLVVAGLVLNTPRAAASKARRVAGDKSRPRTVEEHLLPGEQSLGVGTSRRRPAPQGRYYSISLQHTDPGASPRILRPTRAVQSSSSADQPRVSLWARLRQTQRPWHVCSPVQRLLARAAEPSPLFVTDKTKSGVFEHLRTSLV